MEIQRICIIGAGISGLVTAKTFLEAGYDVTVFEKKLGLGGVWEKSRTYPELTSQTTADTYSFSDYPMPKSYPDWPTAEQIRNYLESYAKHFNVFDKIWFETEVLDVSRKDYAQIKWLVTIKTKDREEIHEFDFVIVCNGMFSTPNIPPIPGKEEFTASGGLILHSTEFKNTSIIEGKRVVVVGLGKSACDIATVAANMAQECTLVFRNALWKVPRFFFGLINLKYLLLTRFSEAWFPYYQMGKLEIMLHSFGKPLVWIFWRTIETVLRLQFRLDSCGMMPDHQIGKYECTISIAPVNFYKYIYTKKIKPIKTSIAKFIPGGVELANGQQVMADVVIFGTGFRQEISFLPEKYHQMLMDEKGNFQLYRRLIHPEIPQMGFVGYNSSLYTQLTSEVGAWWLLEYVKGDLQLPSKITMSEVITADLEWMKNRFLNSAPGGICITTFSLRHVEQLLTDMNANYQPAIWQNISQVMSPVDVSIYRKARQELKSVKQRRHDVTAIS